jgi:predicted ribosome quality control (RQC) complex YloA/Tae2 family protein
VKSWSKREIENVVSSLKPLLGLRLQEVLVGEQDIVLGFYSSSGVLWLWIDLDAVKPGLLPWSELPFKPRAVKSPLLLFLRAHFKDRVLVDVQSSAQFDRVVHLHFGQVTGPRLELELRLFPHARNLQAFAGLKKIAWQKPNDLQVDGYEGDGTLRDLDQLRDEWQRRRGGATHRPSTKSDPSLRWKNDLAKKLKALEKVREELERKREMPWREVGEWLKTHQSLTVKPEWEPFIDKRRKLSWNIEECFSKGREVEGKLIGTQKRLATLQAEIAELRNRIEHPQAAPPPKVASARPAKSEAQARTLHLEGELSVMAGKSAQDNLRLLRKAHSWDLWFHLRDMPSSQAILFRNKNAKISDAVLRQAAQWLIRMSLGAKAKQHVGEKFDVLVTECRFVRPIKGDKIGRVSYQNERLLIVEFAT